MRALRLYAGPKALEHIRHHGLQAHHVGAIPAAAGGPKGLVLLALAATGTVGWWGWLGAIPLATGLFRFCPAYTLLGMNTCPLKKP